MMERPESLRVGNYDPGLPRYIINEPRVGYRGPPLGIGSRSPAHSAPGGRPGDRPLPARVWRNRSGVAQPSSGLTLEDTMTMMGRPHQ